MTQPNALTLLTRAYYHLCDEMRDALSPIARAHSVTVAEIDVDAHPELEDRYGDLVPVLLLGSPEDRQALCHYHLDGAAVEAALARRGRIG